MKRIAILTALILAAVSAFGQAARVDIPLLTSGPFVPITEQGALPQALWVANAAAYLCTHPSTTLAACQAAPITTYTDSTEGTTCPTATPLVQLPGNTCTASTGTAANVGFWYAGGLFDYWIVSSYGTYGPFSGNSTNGATFTGPISGTSASFSGTVSAGTAVSANGILTSSIWQQRYADLESNAGEPSVLWEQNAQLLAVPSTTYVFKRWNDGGCAGGSFQYSESLTALPGSWTYQSTCVVTNTGYARTEVKHYGSTYYLFGVNQTAQNSIDLFTSTTGTSFTLSTTGLIRTGTSGAWDSTFISTGTVYFDGTVWHMLYQGMDTNTTTPWQSGYATASSASGPWTKYSANPVLTTATSPGGMVGGGVSNSYIDGNGNIWIWCQSSTVSGSPTDIYRYTSPDWIHWTRNPSQAVLRRLDPVYEGPGQVGGQLADPTLAEANGSTYMFFSENANQTTGPFSIGLAVAPMTLAQLVQTDEGAANGYNGSVMSGNTPDLMMFGTGLNPIDSDIYVATPGQTSASGNLWMGVRGTSPTSPTGPIGLTGNSNMSIGGGLLNLTGASYYDVSVGPAACVATVTASSKTCIGWNALGNSTSSNSTGVGAGAGSGETTGGNNIYLGTNAGQTNQAGSNNIFIGGDAATSSLGDVIAIGGTASTSNTIQIGIAQTDAYFGNGTTKLHGVISGVQSLPAGSTIAVGTSNWPITAFDAPTSYCWLWASTNSTLQEDCNAVWGITNHTLSIGQAAPFSGTQGTINILGSSGGSTPKAFPALFLSAVTGTDYLGIYTTGAYTGDIYFGKDGVSDNFVVIGKGAPALTTLFTVNSTSGNVTAYGTYTSGSSTGVTKTCTTYPTVVGGIVTGC
jgi:hypothetical protein